jgi:hypothetical protein
MQDYIKQNMGEEIRYEAHNENSYSKYLYAMEREKIYENLS